MPRINWNVRNVALFVGGMFILLLASSAPHRVHHLFDPDSQNSCVVFTLSKGCHLNPTPPANPFMVQTFAEKIFLFSEIWIPYLSPSPYSGRAPPRI
jgi:hypothetical protein